MPNEPPALVGVTGGIGSGKSAVCRHFARLGRRVLSADEIARTLTEEDPQVRDAIGRSFGKELYGTDGRLRREELGRIVFADRSKLNALNAIVHPRVFQSLDASLERFPASSQSPYALVEAALVFESKMDEWLDATIVVRASQEHRIERVLARDGSLREDVLARMSAQIPPDEAAKRADFVIDNDGSEKGLETKVAFLDRILSQMFAAGRKSRAVPSRK
ncbi:MAG TPA: dephospho-CoA kinase [Bacteroidota bacterium]|nr:dephospho-CoA kinase [Bacteroidota bacterium]